MNKINQMDKIKVKIAFMIWLKVNRILINYFLY